MKGGYQKSSHEIREVEVGPEGDRGAIIGAIVGSRTGAGI